MSGKQPEAVPPPPPFKPARPPNSAQIVGNLFIINEALLDDTAAVGDSGAISKALAPQVDGPGGHPPPPPPHSPPPPKPKNGRLHEQGPGNNKELSHGSWVHGKRIHPAKEVLPGGNPPVPPRPCPDPIPPPPRPPRVDLMKAFAILNNPDTLGVKTARLAGKIQRCGVHYEIAICV